MNRRQFLQTTAATAGAALLTPSAVWAADARRLVILHTNDTHSRIDPMPMDGGDLQGLGGVARRAHLIRKIRSDNKHVLLVDSGDIFQGTPYFNFFGGEVEYKAMSAMGYEFATLGNHDFDNGIDGIVRMLPHARFKFLSANYDVSGSALAPHVAPSAIRSYGDFKVGLFGLGISFEGLVLERLHEGVKYLDPIAVARSMVDELRLKGCGLVVCLSHLGYRYRDDQVSDTVLAREVPGIDLILGGHTHTFLNQPDVYKTAEGKVTIVNQVGWAGIRLGRVDITWDASARMDDWYAQDYAIDHRLDVA